MSAAVPVFAWLPRRIDGHLVWLRTFYRVYRDRTVTLSLVIPGDAL